MKGKMLTKTIPIVELRRKLGEVIRDIVNEKQRVVIKKSDIPVAVILGYHDYEDLMDTLEIVVEQTSPEFQKQLNEGEKEYLQGKAKALKKLKAELGIGE